MVVTAHPAVEPITLRNTGARRETAINRGSLRAVHSRTAATLGQDAASKCCRCAGHRLARPPVSFLAYQGLRASLRDALMSG